MGYKKYSDEFKGDVLGMAAEGTRHDGQLIYVGWIGCYQYLCG